MHKQNDPTIDESSASGFVTEASLARHWAISSRTLQRWRKLRKGPAFCNIGGSVRYRIRDILDYERRGRRHIGGEQ